MDKGGSKGGQKGGKAFNKHRKSQENKKKNKPKDDNEATAVAEPKKQVPVQPQSKAIKKDKNQLFKDLKQKNKQKLQTFQHSVPNLQSSHQILQFLNSEIKRHINFSKTKKGGVDQSMQKTITKFEKKQAELFTIENVKGNKPHLTIKEVVEETVNTFLQEGKFLQGKCNVPQVLVLTPNTQTVVDLFKEIRKSFSKYNDSQEEIEVRVQKLFAKHITPEEQAEILGQTTDKKMVNVYVGTPNRVKKLVEIKAIKLKSEQAGLFVFDVNLNPKGLSIFDVYETRDDSFDLLLQAQKQMFKKNIQVYLTR